MRPSTEKCAQQGTQPVEPGTSSPETAAGGRILLADDSEDIRALVATYLEHTPHLLAMAADGQNAVEKFCSGHFDLVLMDVQMPVMGGYAAARAIRAWEAQQRAPLTTILALTGGSIEEDAPSGGEPLFDAQLSKPFRMQTFLEAIEDHLKPRDSAGVAGPAGIERLVPGYLESRKADVLILETALAGGDYETIRVLGHHLKGSGTPYGFAPITQIGKSLESAAASRSPDEIRLQIAALADYLERVTVGADESRALRNA